MMYSSEPELELWDGDGVWGGGGIQRMVHLLLESMILRLVLTSMHIKVLLESRSTV